MQCSPEGGHHTHEWWKLATELRKLEGYRTGFKFQKKDQEEEEMFFLGNLGLGHELPV